MKKKFIYLSVVSLLLLTSCADFFQSRVPMDFESSGGYLEDLLVEDIKGGQLSTPTQVLVSQNLDSKNINITWTEVPDAKAYRIEFAAISPDNDGLFPKTITEEQYSVIEESWYNTTYIHKITDKTISDYDDRFNKRYYYRITATNIREGYDDSLPSSSNIYGTLFAPPNKVLATAGESEDYIKLTWEFTSGAVQYDIYKTESENGSGATLIGSVLSNKNIFIDTITSASDKGKEFYYYIYAINRDGIKSEKSSIAMGYSLVPGAPATSNSVSMIKGRGAYKDAIEISWEPVPGNNVKYNIFRYSSKNSSLVRIKKSSNTTNYKDSSKLEEGIYYYYLIQATIKDETDKELKGAFTKPAEGFILSSPQDISAKKVSGGVTLKWEKALGNEKEQSKYTYKIYASNEINGEFTKILETPDSEVTIGNYNYYKVSTLANNIESNMSEAVAPAPNAVTVVNVSQHDYTFITESIGANEHGVYPVKISWDKPSNDIPYGYFVYRSQNPDSGFRKITNEIILETGNDLFYMDNDPSLLPGKIYYYRVLSANSLEKGDNFSISKYGWGALTHKQYLKEFNKTIISSQKKLTLMHKPGSTDKLGSETKNGTLSGNVYYNAAVSGLGAYITMKYTDYSDFYINPKNPGLGKIFVLNGNSDTSANMSSNGTMNGTITCSGMYPGRVNYNRIEIKSGAAGGGSYEVTPENFTTEYVNYNVLEEN